jgi:hypothetical protein
MENNSLPLVSKEQALKLKELGFDWPCNAFYDNLTTQMATSSLVNWNDFSGISAPTVALALKWMRDVHNEFTDIEVLFIEFYEQRESEVLDELLDNLINQKNNKI